MFPLGSIIFILNKLIILLLYKSRGVNMNQSFKSKNNIIFLLLNLLLTLIIIYIYLICIIYKIII